MIMALATCGHQSALQLLRELALKPLGATMICVALGDGIVRLGRDHPNLNFLAERTPYDGLRFWPAAAAAGWNGSRIKAFLTACASSPREDVADAAKASLEGRYKTYQPL
ncbi:hypothetical protein [Nonomuraea jiangxiensis]|uniref:Uncharacterized protein n=1 Tax=Nonomuraea jiangxiensis TaxID=633440 RepID=A0A1G9I2C1_9ACTN|nr:hypothetical protein [Nonomuraea jiangxiensis]SDL18963.1 hypothetical protein SAMN05421869_12350 [Nonomuraea jiangxiensis]